MADKLAACLAALGSPSEAWQPRQPNVTVRCVTCGCEIWQEVPDYTTFEQARAAKCSDCFLECIAALFDDGRHTEGDVGA